MAHSPAVDIWKENRRADELTPAFVIGGVALGVAGATLGVILAFIDGWDQFLIAYLINFAYILSLTLGALFFVLIQHLTRSGWSVAVRRPAEVIAASVPWLALLGVPLLVGMRLIYPWVHPETLGAEAELVHEKSPYLNPAFFVARFVAYFVIWWLLARFFLRASTSQDESGDVQLTRSMERVSAPGMVLFALTTTFAAFDLLMSLTPTWYSTIYGVYYFAGCVVGFLSLLILTLLWLQLRGRLERTVTNEHYHDLGKLLFAFVVFWAYIAYSQYMLIWYANIPESVGWFYVRQQSAWTTVSLVLLFGHFLLPFLALMSRVPKRRGVALALAALWMLAAHWVDVYYLVAPARRGGDMATPHLIDIALLASLGGFFAAIVAARLGRYSLLCERDPRLAESLAFENT